ncbi:MAG: hypoxanthine phosphoribosyltransferase [Deltaproteobacteria bacterium]|nr:hypoxanthine phosphoribosyltransferase [Deltaproteobacteria bacterium]MBI3294746.1 hypoxanthine phosphoribosyltransferase [Deltaproteobacteria bacterium]
MNRPEVTMILTAGEIRSRVEALSREINTWLAGQPVVAICVLKSGFVFYSDLVRCLKTPVHCEFAGMASPESLETRTGEMGLTIDCVADVAGKNVIIVDDIVSTGLTLTYLDRLFKSRQAKSVKICALATKQKKSIIPLSVDYLGFSLEDKFYVGYGMDYCGWFRELPGIGVPTI